MKCCAPRCKNRDDRRREGLAFHRFPRDPVMKESWLRGIGRETWSPGERSIVCCFHFKNSDYMAGQRAMSRLKPKAVPSLVNIEEYNGPSQPEVTTTESTAAAEDSDCQASEMPPCEDRQASPLQDAQEKDAGVSCSSVANPSAASTASSEDLVICEALSPSPDPCLGNESREPSPSPSAHPADLAATPPRHGAPAEREDTPEKAFLRSEVTRYSNLYRAGKKKIKGLQQCRRRLASKVARLQDVVKELEARVLDF